MKHVCAAIVLMTAFWSSACGTTEDKSTGECGVDVDCTGQLICVQSQCVQPNIEMDLGGMDMSSPEPDMATPDAADDPDLVAADMASDGMPPMPDMQAEADMAPDPPDMRSCADVGAPTAAISGRAQFMLQYTSQSMNAGLQQVVELTAANSSDPGGLDLTYDWTLASSPANSMPSFTSTDGEASFTGDLEGTYRVELTATNTDGVESCNTAMFDIEVGLAGPGITYVLTWETPSVVTPVPGMGADVDIHYKDKVLGSWSQGAFDIYWRNETADWGMIGPPNDAILANDSETSAAGEVVYHPSPEDRVYSLGAHYYRDNSLGVSNVTLQLYVDGQLRFEYQNQPLQARGEFWYAIDYDVATDTVTEVLQVTETFPNLMP